MGSIFFQTWMPNFSYIGKTREPAGYIKAGIGHDNRREYLEQAVAVDIPELDGDNRLDNTGNCACQGITGNPANVIVKDKGQEQRFLLRISWLRLNVNVPIIEPHIPMQCMLLNKPIKNATK